MRIVAVPVKSLSRTKSRLAPVLSPLERAAITLAMLEDVLDAALLATGWETWVVSPDETVLEVAAGRGVRPLVEERPPLSSAVRQVEREALEADASALAILFADLPLITPDALIAALRTIGPVVVAPSHSDGGTNLLLRRPPRALPARFGRDSFLKHVQTARSRGLPVAVVAGEPLGFDLDSPDDFRRLIEAHDARRAGEVCRELDVAARLRVGV